MLAAASFVVTVLLLEVGLRLFFSPYITPIYRLDDACQFRPKEGTAHYWQQVPPNYRENVLVSINEDGYRGPERPYLDDETRVMVFGDSFVMAEFSQQDETFCHHLEQELKEALQGPVHVVNAGTAGGGPDQYISRIRAEVPKVKPDLLIVAFYAGNDFGDLIRDKMFRVAEDGSVVANAFTFSDKTKREFALAGSTAIYRMVHRLRIHQRLANGVELMQTEDPEERRRKAYDLVERDLVMCAGEYREFVEKKRDDVRVLLDDHYDSDLSLQPDLEASRYKLRLMEGVIERIAAAAKELKVPLLTIAIPAPVDTCDVYQGGAVDPEKWPQYRRSRLTDQIVRISTDNGLPCLDLFAPFRVEKESVYLQAPDIHWNEKGQKVAAKLTRERIVNDRLLGAR